MSAVKVFWKHCEKRRNWSLPAISPFPAVFSTDLENFLPFLSILKLLSANPFSLVESKICRLGKGLEGKPTFENNLGKEENTCNHFLL